MRKLAWLLALILLLTACSAEASRGTILRYVEVHQQELERRVETGDFDGIGLPVLEVNAGETCVEFECGGSGFGPETSYRGFFYSAEDDIYAVWCAPPRGTLCADGDGWSWQETDGDNECYIQHIVGHFYYYEAHF